MLPLILSSLLSTTTTAHVLPLVLTSSPPAISSPSVPLTCSAAATGETPEILWLRDGVQVAGEEKREARGQMVEVVTSLLPGCTSVPHVYTCLAMAGGSEVSSETLVLPVQEEEECHRQETVTTWYSNVLARLGSDVELRCDEVVEGVRIPGIWEGQEATGGQLVFSNVRWEDMGVYSCVTQEGEIRQTFLYPYTP